METATDEENVQTVGGFLGIFGAMAKSVGTGLVALTEDVQRDTRSMQSRRLLLNRYIQKFYPEEKTEDGEGPNLFSMLGNTASEPLQEAYLALAETAEFKAIMAEYAAKPVAKETEQEVGK